MANKGLINWTCYKARMLDGTQRNADAQNLKHCPSAFHPRCAWETPARSIRKRLMFQFPVEIALAMARVSFERSCHDSRISGYLRGKACCPRWRPKAPNHPNLKRKLPKCHLSWWSTKDTARINKACLTDWFSRPVGSCRFLQKDCHKRCKPRGIMR